MTKHDEYLNAFYAEVAQGQKLWTIQDDKGIPTPLNSEKIKSMPFWSSLDKAQAYIQTKAGFAEFTPLEIDWPSFADKWAQGLWRDGLCAGINWLGDSETNLDIEVNELVDNIKALLPKA